MFLKAHISSQVGAHRGEDAHPKHPSGSLFDGGCLPCRSVSRTRSSAALMCSTSQPVNIRAVGFEFCEGHMEFLSERSSPAVSNSGVALRDLVPVCCSWGWGVGERSPCRWFPQVAPGSENACRS